MFHPLHPAIVHFVIALFTFSIILDIFGLLTSRDKFHYAAWVNLQVAGIAALLAIGSGLVEENRVTIPKFAIKSFEIHETTAFITASIVMILIFWRIRFRSVLPKKIRIFYLAIALFGTISLHIGTYYGTKLVYRYRIGPESNIEIENQSRGVFPDSIQVAPDEFFYEITDSAP